MGSLTSRPAIAQPYVQPQVVYAPPPRPAAQAQEISKPAPSGNVSEGDADSAQDADLSNADQQREDNLLTRSRSRFGTIKTGFRGLLSLSDPTANRKTLLGE